MGGRAGFDVVSLSGQVGRGWWETGRLHGLGLSIWLKAKLAGLGCLLCERQEDTYIVKRDNANRRIPVSHKYPPGD